MKALLILLAPYLLLFACQSPEPAPEPTIDDIVHDGIRWNGENETANHLANSGRTHFSNVEFNLAYQLSEAAVKVDPTLFASHTLLAFMSEGEKKEHHKKMANKHVSNENETAKLFVSLLDVEDDSTRAQRRAIWTKMHEMSNGPFIHLMYAQFMDIEADTAAVINEFDKLIAFCNENGITVTEAAAYNIKGYVLNAAGDLEGGTAAIEKYLELYDGYNAIDSRAEFYLFAGDTTSAIEWYKKVVEKNPFAQSARQTLEDLGAEN